MFMKEMVVIEEKVVKMYGWNFILFVIELLFGIGCIMYCLYEYCFYLWFVVFGE